MSKKRLFIALLLSVVLGGVGYTWWRAASVATLSFSWGSATKKHLEAFNLPASSFDVTDITVREEDGNSPEIAFRYFKVGLDERPQLKSFFAKQCRAFGMGDPAPDNLRLEPDTLCMSRKPGETLQFLMHKKCGAENCLIGLELSRFSF